MSVFAACLHKAEWVCATCARCGSCCVCDVDPPNLVHINTKEAALALAKAARAARKSEASY